MRDNCEDFKSTGELMEISGVKERELRTFKEKIFHQSRETLALIPFFAFRELSRVLGGGVLGALFLHARARHSQMQHFNLNQRVTSNS